LSGGVTSDDTAIEKLMYIGNQVEDVDGVLLIDVPMDPEFMSSWVADKVHHAIEHRLEAFLLVEL
jgi:hypothetical protein